MHHKRKETAWLIWIASKGQFICLDHGSNCHRADGLLGHVNTKQRCEIQSVWNAWIQLITQAEHEKDCVQRDSQEAFQSAHRQYLPWIYCNNTYCTMVLRQKCGIFTLSCITGVMVYNYSKYVWLRQLYSMCAFILNGFRLMFFIQIGYLKTI